MYLILNYLITIYNYQLFNFNKHLKEVSLVTDDVIAIW